MASTKDSTRHTDGPWFVKKVATKYRDLFEYTVLAPNEDAGREGVCYRGRYLRVCSGLDSEPDARLIAAAPELVALLTGTAKYCPVDIQDQIRALLTRIETPQP